MKKFYNPLKLFKVLLISILINVAVIAQNPSQSLIDVSNITSWVSDSGFHDWPIDKNFNGSYPNGLPVGVIFSEGINWGGLVYDGNTQLVRVNGNTYSSGCSPITRLYRVRTDYYDADLTNDAANFFIKAIKNITPGEIETIKNQYETDWNEWPADRGAPYYDADKDGKYNPDVDIPGVPGALQTIWINYYDELSNLLYGSDPIGLQIQETYWTYTSINPLGNVIYKKVDFIYRGTSSTSADSKIDSMYIHEWCDPDIGWFTDDLVGCDTTLNLGFAFNSTDSDLLYDQYNIAPPAVGYSILQGASSYTGNYSDSAIINFKWRKGYRYFRSRPLNGFVYQGVGGSWSDPSFDYEGSLEYYNIMRGFLPYPVYPRGTPFPAVLTDYTSSGFYLLDGDPITGTGKIDGIYDSPGSRRFYVITGPFNMNLGDTAEVVIALVGGMGDNHLASVSNLKYNTKGAIDYYNFIVQEMTNGSINISSGRPKAYLTPDNYVLFQNYPNPFNSFTTFKYEIPEQAFVKLIIFDVLGREVKRLVNEEKTAGRYSVSFDAKDLSSGVYFYRITFDNASNKLVNDGLTKTMKFILLK